MSLINKVLKDLDKRQKSDNASQSATEGLKPRYRRSAGLAALARQKMVLILIIIIAIIALVVGLLWHTSGSEQAQQSKQVATQTDKQSSQQKANQQAQQQEQAEQKTQQKPQKPKPAQVVSAKVHIQQKHHTRVILGLTRSIQYQIEHKNGDKRQIILHLRNTQAKALGLSLPKTLSALTRVTQDNTQGDQLNLHFYLQNGAKLKHVELDKSKDPVQLVLNFILPEQQHQKLKQSILAITQAHHHYQQNQQAKKAYQHAVQPLQQGEFSQAEQKLVQVVHQYPQMLKARITLVKVLLKNNKLQQAYQYLQHALQKRPDDVDLIMLKARYYYQQRKMQQALRALESIDPPPIKQHPQYYAFTAALQRQLDNDAVAAQLYHQLLELDPDRSVWWLGLGLSYKDAGQYNRAKQAFQKALNTGHLNPKLRAYVASQIQQ